MGQKPGCRPGRCKLPDAQRRGRRRRSSAQSRRRFGGRQTGLGTGCVLGLRLCPACGLVAALRLEDRHGRGRQWRGTAVVPGQRRDPDRDDGTVGDDRRQFDRHQPAGGVRRRQHDQTRSVRQPGFGHDGRPQDLEGQEHRRGQELAGRLRAALVAAEGRPEAIGRQHGRSRAARRGACLPARPDRRLLRLGCLGRAARGLGRQAGAKSGRCRFRVKLDLDHDQGVPGRQA